MWDTILNNLVPVCIVSVTVFTFIFIVVAGAMVLTWLLNVVWKVLFKEEEC